MRTRIRWNEIPKPYTVDGWNYVAGVGNILVTQKDIETCESLGNPTLQLKVTQSADSVIRELWISSIA